MSAITKVIEGTHAISYAVQRARARVIAAYPITPSSGVVELLSEMCGDGRMDARFVAVESEHSALATCAGASQAGLRAFTATSSHGLAYMHEMLHWCAGARLPIVLANVNRSMGSPWNIFVDQNDSLSQRDTGWIQYYCENNQEVLDTVIQAFRVAEQVGPPAGNGVQVAAPVATHQPRAFATCNGQQRQRAGVLAHLGARMPQHGQVALAPTGRVGLQRGRPGRVC